VIGICPPPGGAQEFRKFLDEVERNIVMDNASSHEINSSQTALAELTSSRQIWCSYAVVVRCRSTGALTR
jgi:hypothetical protein